MRWRGSSCQRYSLDVADNRVARGVYTQVMVLKKIAVGVIAVFAIASMLMVFQSGAAVRHGHDRVGRRGWHRHRLRGAEESRHTARGIPDRHDAADPHRRCGHRRRGVGQDRRDHADLRRRVHLGPAPPRRAHHLFHREAVSELDAHVGGHSRNGFPAGGLWRARRRCAPGAHADPRSFAKLGSQGERAAGHRCEGAHARTARACQLEQCQQVLGPALRDARKARGVHPEELSGQPAAPAYDFRAGASPESAVAG